MAVCGSLPDPPIPPMYIQLRLLTQGDFSRALDSFGLSGEHTACPFGACASDRPFASRRDYMLSE